MPQLHCEIETLDDGTVIAHSPDLTLTILPDGEAEAFNRNFIRHKMLDKPLHAKLNILAAEIQQKKMTEIEVWTELVQMVEERTQEPHERWLVGKLNDVRVYINGQNIILTTRDLYK